MRRLAGVLLIVATATMTIVAADAVGVAATAQPPRIAGGGLRFISQPTDTIAGSLMPRVVVAAHAAGGSVTLTITAGTGPSGATLTHPATQPLVGGSATFDDLQIDTAGVGYTLTAVWEPSAGTAVLDQGTPTASLTGTSEPFDVTPAAPNRLRFTAQPTTVVAGAPLLPIPVVAVEDAFGNLTVRPPVPVTVSVRAGDLPVPVTGTTSVESSNGQATFPDLRIAQPGDRYTLVATAAPLTSAVSLPFQVLPASTIELTFTEQPHVVVAGAALSVALRLRSNGAGAATPADRDVTLVLQEDAGATLRGATTARTVRGAVTFRRLSIHRAGTGYRLVAKASGVTPAVSASFAVRAAEAVKLVFTGQPGAGTTGSVLGRQPRISVQDRYGNAVDSAPMVTVALAPGGAAGRLSCDGGTTHRADHGVVALSGCRVDRPGADYRLVATATELTAGLSTPFRVAQAATTTRWWLVGVAAAGVVAVIAAVVAAARWIRRRRLRRPPQHVQAVAHPDVGAVGVAGAQPRQTHNIRLEPHADPGRVNKGERR